MPIYKRKEGSDVWHWCVNCSEYPTGENVTSRQSKPEYGTMCPECEIKEKTGDCKTDSLFSVLK